MATVERESSSAAERKRGSGRRATWARLIPLLLAVFCLSACATTAPPLSGIGFEKSSVDGAELWIGNRLLVQRECENRGVALYANDTKILGCTDFARRVIVSINDSRVIDHERCHWNNWTASHDTCPLPMVSWR